MVFGIIFITFAGIFISALREFHESDDMVATRNPTFLQKGHFRNHGFPLVL
jgi:hypothetical protein